MIKQFKILKAETRCSIMFSKNIKNIIVIVLIYPLFVSHSGMSHVNVDTIVCKALIRPFPLQVSALLIARPTR
jgi:hypothetical protein